MNNTLRLLTLIIFSIFSFGVLSVTANERVPIPDNLFYYQPAASVFGSEAIWVNPAGLGAFKVSGYQLMFEGNDDNFAKSWGSVVHRESFALAIRKLENPIGENYHEFIGGLGFSSSKDLNAGVSYRYFKEGPGIYNNRHLWVVGFSGNLDYGTKWGVVFSNLNRGKIDGMRTEMEMRYSLAYRFQKIPLTISADMFLSTGTKINNSDFVYHAEYSPTKGLYLNAMVDNSQNFTLGIRANFHQFFFGNKSSFDDGGTHRHSTMYLGATSMKQPSLIDESKRMLKVSITGRPSENPPRPYFGPKRESFLQYLLQIYRAADDPLIVSMDLRLDRARLGFAQADELKTALTYFQSKKKRIFCHIKYPSNISYYIASGCDEIAIPPVSQLHLTGLRAELTFYAGLMDKIGLHADMMRIGDYKTAPERYTDSASSAPNKEQLNRELDRLYELFVDGIAEGRSVPPDSVRKIINNGPFTSEEALQHGLVDTLLISKDIKFAKHPTFKLYPTISISAYREDTLQNQNWYDKPVIGVLVADGEIAYTDNGLNPLSTEKVISPKDIEKGVRQIKQDGSVNAVLVRVDSPGGDALAGEEIYQSIYTLKKSNTVGISFGNIAASGGYYIATPGEFISASRGTITGSIGIFGGKLDASGFYDKVGINKELYLRGQYAGMMTTMRPFTEQERKKYFSQMQALYDHFVSLVAENRDLPADSIDRLGQGKVWVGEEAQRNGLVDNTGGFIRALNELSGGKELSEYRVKFYPEKRPFIEFPGKSVWSPFVKLFLNDTAPDTSLLHFEDYAGMFSRLPYDIHIE